jgi:class 3 adenylate cyclase
MAQKDLHSFLFADISGYSRLTEMGGDEVGAELALRFASAAERIAHEHGAKVVKRVGDAVMLRCDCAAELVALGLRLQDELGGLPIHAGIHTGCAVERGGDWWGTTVNVAARVAAAAGAGQLLITEETRAAAGLRRTKLRGLGKLTLKNISAPVRVYAVSRAPARAMPALARRRPAGQRARQLALFDWDRAPAALAFKG